MLIFTEELSIYILLNFTLIFTSNLYFYTYCLISKQYIYIWHEFHHWFLKELTQKWSRQVKTEYFVVITGMSGYLHHGWRAYSQWEALKCKNLLHKDNPTQSNNQVHYNYISKVPGSLFLKSILF